MHVKRFADAKPYEAPNHRGVVGLRLQGFEPGGPTNQWVGLSQFLPGGGAGPGFDAVREGLCRARRPDDGHRRWQGDGAGPDGFLHHRRRTKRAKSSTATNDVCKMLVVIPYPPGAKP